MKTLLSLNLFLGLMLFCCDYASAQAKSIPEWIQRPPQETAEYKFYIGRSSGSVSETAGYEEAFRMAQEAAIRENFGFETQIQQQEYSEPTQATYLKHTVEASAKVKVVGFEQVDSFHEQSTAEHREAWGSVWVLYRYSKQEINVEKKRLNELANTMRQVPSQSTIGSGTGDGSTIEVDTTPSDATVLLDGERWGTTPLRLIGKIKKGIHEVVLDHPSHEPIQTKIIVTQNGVIKLTRSLKPAFGQVHIKALPQVATISLGDQPIGSGPSLTKKFRAGQTIFLKVSHPHYYAQTREVYIARGMVQNLEFALEIKEAHLGVPTLPSEASVLLDGALQNRRGEGREVSWIQVIPGSHTYEMVLNGCPPIQGNIEVHPHERKVIDALHACETYGRNLTATPLPPTGEADSPPAKHPLNFSIGPQIALHLTNLATAYGSPYLQVGLQANFNLKATQYRLAVSYDTTTASSSARARESFSFTGASVALFGVIKQFEFRDSKQSVGLLMPFAGLSQQSYTFSSTVLSRTSATNLSQFSWGCAFDIHPGFNKSNPVNLTFGVEHRINLNTSGDAMSGFLSLGYAPPFFGLSQGDTSGH